MDETTRNPGGIQWEPYLSYGRVRVIETSCCGAFEWVCQGGQFFVLRAKEGGGFEEAGRGRYALARKVWTDLVLEHGLRHRIRSG